MNNIKVSASGRYGFRLEDVDGSVIFESKFHNVLTNEALYYLTSEDRIVSDFGVVAASKWTSLFGRCALGTGTSVSTPTDRTLTSPSVMVGSVRSMVETVTDGSGSYLKQIFNVAFESAQGNGSWTEVGMFNTYHKQADGSPCLMSRTLIKDSEGNPVVLKKQTGQRLHVTFEFRFYPPVGDRFSTIYLADNAYEYRLRTLATAATEPGMGWLDTDKPPSLPGRIKVFNTASLISSDSELDGFTSNEVATDHITYEWLDDVADMTYRDVTITTPDVTGNMTDGISLLATQYFQAHFSPNIPKDANSELSLTFRYQISQNILPEPEVPPPPPIEFVDHDILLGGDLEYGFYGEVPASELIDGDTLISKVGIVQGVPQHTDEPWLKLVIDGKICYMAKKTYTHSTSWDHLNDQGVVFGETTVTIDDVTYRVRVPKGFREDADYTSEDAVPYNTIGSEWNRLMYPLHGLDQDSDMVEDELRVHVGAWYDYNHQDLHVLFEGAGGEMVEGTWSHCQEPWPGSPDARVTRLFVDAYGGSNYTYVIDDYNGWRPILESDMSAVGYPTTGELPLGPGPQTLMSGDATNGLYGEVFAEHFIDGASLAYRLGLTVGGFLFINEPWLKYSIDGKVLYVPKKCLFSSVSKDHLRHVNIVTGDRTVEFGGFAYRVRLINGFGPGFTELDFADEPIFTDEEKISWTHGSEWNRLMYQVSDPEPLEIYNDFDYKDPNYTMGSLAQLSQRTIRSESGHYDLDLGVLTICADVYAMSGEFEFTTLRGGEKGVFTSEPAWAGDVYEDCGWRPVLELIGPVEVPKVPPLPGSDVPIGHGPGVRFYGEVPVSELIDGDTLAKLVGISEGSPFYPDEPWLKYYKDGTYLYVAKKLYWKEISWSHLNSLGVVHGEKRIKINGVTYKVRLMNGLGDVPTGWGLEWEHEDVQTFRSEWNRLIYPISDGEVTNIWHYQQPDPSIPYAQWASYTAEELHWEDNVWTLCRDGWPETDRDNYTVIRGNEGSGNWSDWHDSWEDSEVGWRPVLEVVVESPPVQSEVGPGPQTLIAGDSTAGFYGEVVANQLISYGELSELVGLTSGTLINDAESQWLKFSLDRKTLFVPMKPVRHSITWDHLDDLDLVYGGRIVTIKDRRYVCRLFKGSSADPAPGDFGYNTSNTFGSEWNRLMYPIHNGVHFNGNNPTLPEMGTWAQYSDNDLVVEDSGYKLGSYTWCQETRSADASVRVVRGGLGLTRILFPPRNSTSEGRGWRPVLELLDEV